MFSFPPIPTLRRSAVAALTAVILSTALMTVATPSAEAQAPTFDCDPGFYQVIEGQFAEFDPATDVYTPLGTQGAKYNAIGYRTADGYMYGFQGRNLIRVDAAGGVTVVGTPELGANSFTGDFGDDGLLHASRGGRDWVTVDVDTLEVTWWPEVSGNIRVADITNVNGTFYGVSSTGYLYVIDPSNRTVMNGGLVEGLAGSGAFGAAWSTAGGNLYVGRNSGQIYQISGYSTGNPSAYQVATAKSTNSNDGASCPYAPPPPGIRDVDGAEPETAPTTQEGQAAQQQYEQTYDESEQEVYAFEDAGLGEGPSCGATTNEDRLPRMAVNAADYAEGSVLYETGFDGDADYLILSGSWEQSGSMLRQIKDCGYDYTSLLPTPQVEYFRYEATFSPIDGSLNGGGIVFNQSSEHTRSGAMIVDVANGGAVLRWGRYDDAGYYQFIGGVPVDGSGTSQVAVEVRGNAVDIYFNGEMVGSTETPNPGGYVGVVATRSKVGFDHARLSALAAS